MDLGHRTEVEDHRIEHSLDNRMWRVDWIVYSCGHRIDGLGFGIQTQPQCCLPVSFDVTADRHFDY